VELCIILHDEEIAMEEYDLEVALVAVIGGTWPSITIAEARD
jgi:hypothetical protein